MIARLAIIPRGKFLVEATFGRRKPRAKMARRSLHVNLAAGFGVRRRRSRRVSRAPGQVDRAVSRGGGQIEMLFFNTPAALPYIQAGKLRALGVSTAKRSSLLPAVPTIAEAGVPGFDISVWFGLVAPAGTPPDIITKPHRDIARVIAQPDVRKQLLDIGAEPGCNTPEELAMRIKKDSALWAQVVQAAKIRFD